MCLNIVYISYNAFHTALQMEEGKNERKKEKEGKTRRERMSCHSRIITRIPVPVKVGMRPKTNTWDTAHVPMRMRGTELFDPSALTGYTLS